MKHKLIIAAYTLLIGSLSIGQLQAQDTASTRKITLQEAIDLSIKNSKQLKVSQAKIAEAKSSLKETLDHRLPDFSVSGSYLYLPIAPNVELHSSKSSSSTTSTSGSGTTAASSTPVISQAMYGIANISLPIYNGGKLKYAIASGKYLAQAVALDADKDREDVVMNTIAAFINLYKAKEEAKLVKENLDQSKKRIGDFSNLEKNGLLARNDLLKVELQSSNIELSLLDAENNWKLASINMDLMLGISEKTELIPDTVGIPSYDSVKTIADYEQAALQGRKDFASLALQRKVADLGIKNAKADLYPSLALTGGYIAAYVPNFVTITNAVNIGVGVKYNVASLWKTKSKVQQAESRVLQIKATEELLSDNIRLQINQSYQNYLLSQKKIQVYEKAVDQAGENYRITKNKYDNSLVTTTDLLDADLASLQAKLNYSAAKADAVVAYNKLLQTAGLLNNK